ncbi:MAG: imidazole glycerol phosphate synthase subunit HisH [Bacteroidia bacterium]|nr:imidazole glycerol phosphate synthase subunit HisH [Bacteroidia bacterium]
MITIIDYKTGNLGSIQNMLKKIRVESVVTSNPSEIESASKIILPGVGSFDQGMQNLNNLQIKDILNKKVLTDKTPVLGICLGMQLMTLGSEEGKLPGLGWIDAESVRFRFYVPSKFKSPHMGWNSVRLHKDSRLLKDMLPESRFYFVHSYYIRSNDPSDILTSTEYEREFTSSFERENIIGVQFHPEKSHKFGMALLKNFAELY